MDRMSLPFKYLWVSLEGPDTQLSMPVRGVSVREVTDTWGAAREGARQHAGQDIFARRGTPVYSATDGYVWHIGESQRGGKTVTGVASGFITSAPVRVLHMIGSRLATMVATVMTFGRKRRRAPSLIAWSKSSELKAAPRSSRFFFSISSR